MNREQLHKNFKIEMDKNAANIAFGSYPAFLPEEIDHWLNQAMFQELATKFTGRNFAQVPFEGTVKRIQDLERLVCTDVDVAAKQEKGTNRVYVTNLLNSTSVDNTDPDEGDGVEGSDDGTSISDDTGGQTETVNNCRMFFVNATLKWAKQTKDDKDKLVYGPTSKATVIMIDHLTANRFLETYNNKPWIDTPVAIIENNTLYIYKDPYTDADTFKIDITYIKYPTLVEDLEDDTDELPEYMWYEIVNKAVQLALENIESQRVQTKSQLNQTNE